MTPASAGDWLDDWIDDNLSQLIDQDSGNRVTTIAAKCRAAAKSAGIGEAELQQAAGGSLEGYLREWRVVLADPDLAS